MYAQKIVNARFICAIITDFNMNRGLVNYAAIVYIGLSDNGPFKPISMFNLKHYNNQKIFINKIKKILLFPDLINDVVR